MNVLIVEDEAPASRRLLKLLHEIDSSIQVSAVLESIESTVQWLKVNPPPDLVFMDIQLSDGLSFDIFKSVSLNCPVIFTTAYDDYAIQAFKVNSIDYLLKPIDSKDLNTSLGKYKKMQDTFSVQYRASEISDLLKTLSPAQPVYKSRFLIKSGTNLLVIATNEIGYIISDNKITYLITNSGKKHIVDYTLEELEELLDPSDFFRANRKFIINIFQIESISNLFSGKLKLKTKLKFDEDIIISRERSSLFRHWLDR
ncbi:MAG: LytR/AlgR family response regulator transcription factor [Methanococcaceae archaeon]